MIGTDPNHCVVSDHMVVREAVTADGCSTRLGNLGTLGIGTCLDSFPLAEDEATAESGGFGLGMGTSGFGAGPSGI